MKTKIAAISLLTVVVLVLSILILQTTVSNIKQEALLLTVSEGGQRIKPDQITQEMKDLPVYKKRSTSTRSYSPANPDRSSSYSVSHSKSAEYGITTSGSPTSFSGTESHVRGSQKASDAESSVNYRPLAAAPSWRQRPSGAMSVTSSGVASDGEQTVSNSYAPFSGGGPSGPMRMDGDDDNPPPEGMPVGNGLWLMMFFAGIYILIKRLKNSHLAQ